jgi:hypothetical protein
VKKFRLSLLLALLALALGVAFDACGGSESDEEKVVSALETAATSTDPASCKELSTQNFMNQTEAATGTEAVKACEENVKNVKNNPKSVEVTNVKIKGEKATADVAFTGGTFDGQTLAIALLKEGGDWKRDEVTEIAKLDKAKLVAAVEESLESGNGGLDPQTSSCIGKGLSKMSQPGIEKVLFSGSRQPLTEIYESCKSQQ